MSLFTRRSHPTEVQRRSPAIESLEGRAYFSGPALIVSIPGPLPGSAIAGVTVHQKIAIDIANNGPGALRGPFTLTLFASVDQTLSEDDAQLVQRILPRSFALRSGTHRTFVLNIKAYPKNLDNSYFVVGDISTADGDVIGVSTSTMQISPPTIDFTDTVTPNRATGLVGHLLPVTVDVTNHGNVIAKGNLAVNFGESVDPSGSSPINLATLSKHIHIKPNTTEVFHFLVRLPLGISTGNQFIVAVADPSDVYNELNPDDLTRTAVSGKPVSIT